MTKKQEEFFAMVLKVKNFYAKNSAGMTAVPAIVPFYTQLNTLVPQLINADTGSRADLTGYAINKANKRSVLETLALKVSNAISAYGVVNGDPVLLKRGDFPTSKWYSCSEEELVTQATILKNLATPIGAALVPFGATVAEVTALGTNINTFTDIISDPNLAVDQRKEDNAKVVTVIEQIRTLLTDKLDIVMRSFEVNNPSIFNLYRSARALDINGSSTAPTSITDVAPASTKTLYTATSYSADTFYTLQNMGTEAVQFSLSATTDTEGPEVVVLNPGETRSRLAENLAPMGTFLVVKNASAIPVKVRLWVE